jgi:hypothetical protein
MRTLQLVTFEQAKKLKELGFDWEVETAYNIEGNCYFNFHIDNLNNENNYYKSIYTELYSAPSVALALKWLRDEKKVYGHIIAFLPDLKIDIWRYYSYSSQRGSAGNYATYEEAESDLLNRLLMEASCGLRIK